MMMNRRRFLVSAAAGAWSFHGRATAQRRPNVVVILTDDQGWGDLSIHGNTNLATPNVDSLARDGALFHHYYVCALCAPTRAEFLTGRYHTRGGVRGVSTGLERLNLDETTIAETFQSAGYATGAFGKWHNGSQLNLESKGNPYLGAVAAAGRPSPYVSGTETPAIFSSESQCGSDHRH